MSAPLKITNDVFPSLSMVRPHFLNWFKGLLLAVCSVAGLTDVAFAMAGQPGGGKPQGPGAMLSSFLPLILIFVIFYFLLIRPQSKKAKEHKQMLENLKKGDKIMTNGGILGVIEDIDGETLTVKIGVGSDVKVRVNRGSIASIRGKE
jgi:preprotein translocase subunit YajC